MDGCERLITLASMDEVISYIRRRFPYRIDAEDIVSEAWLRCWKRYGDVPLPRLRLAAKRLAINQCAKNRREESLAGDVEARAERLLPRVPLERLPDDERRLIELVYLEGLSTRAAGDKLGLTKSKAKTRKRRALGRLARLLPSCDEF